MPLAESTIQNHIRDTSAQFGDDLWRNNVGVAQHVDGLGNIRPVRYGLLNDSSKLNKVCKSSDLIGMTRVMITPEMVGTMVSVFTAIEVKEEGWRYAGTGREVAQKVFIDMVLRAGGYAGFAQSVDDYRRIIRK